MASLELPDIPDSAEDFEHYAAALLQSAGYYVERNVHERESSVEILELDVVATIYSDDCVVESILAEAKSGDWGIPQLFKLRGQMAYLAIPRGLFFALVEHPDKPMPLIRDRARSIDIDIMCVGDASQLRSQLSDAGFVVPPTDMFTTLWRWLYAVERSLIGELRTLRKSTPASLGLAAVVEYQNFINDEIFFEYDRRARLSNMYSEWGRHPRLTLSLALEMDGQSFDPDPPLQESQKLKEAMFGGAHPGLQASMFIENFARLSLLKAAIDFHCGLAPEPEVVFKGIGGRAITMDDFMPGSFQQGIKQLKQHPHFTKYALFWQAFLGIFGGFYLRDREQEEFKLMSEYSGIPIAEIPQALRAFDILFPGPKGGWLTNVPNTQLAVMKMMPAAIRGVGVSLRFERYGWANLGTSGYTDYTAQDLYKWISATVALLNRAEKYWRPPKKA